MNRFREYDQYDGLGLAELVRKKEITSGELINEALHRIEKINPKLNAVVRIVDTAGTGETGDDASAPGPFSGVPFLLKDVHHALKGEIITSGSNSMKHYVAPSDAMIVKRFKQAGVRIIGKTNTPEFKMGGVTEPVIFGPTRNPWNLDYSCGGSSGGSAAAVAAGIVPMASGTDEGGSIRVPSSYCGLFGLKPSRGRNPVGPDFDNASYGLSTSHIVSRSVRDSAAVLDAVSGPEPGSTCSLSKPEKSFLACIASPPSQLRIALHLPCAFGKHTSPECARAVTHTARLLENLGHRVEEVDFGYSEEDVMLNWCLIIAGHLAVYLNQLIEKGIIKGIDSSIELQNRTVYALGKRMKSRELGEALHYCSHLSQHLAIFMNRYDVLLTPTLGELPVKVGSQNPGGIDKIGMKFISSGFGRLLAMSRSLTGSLFRELVRNVMESQMSFTMAANLTGQPAMSVPLFWSGEGLPCGVQFIGRYGEEALLLRLAAQLEKAYPWFQKRPQVV